MTKQQKIDALIKECQLLKIKADKWDALDDDVAAFYFDEDGKEIEGEGDLCVIGEAAARALGYL